MLAVPGAAVIPGPLAPPVQLIPLPIPLPVAVTADVFADVRVTVMPLVNDAFVDAARDPLNVTDDPTAVVNEPVAVMVTAPLSVTPAVNDIAPPNVTVEPALNVTVAPLDTVRNDPLVNPTTAPVPTTMLSFRLS